MNRLFFPFIAALGTALILLSATSGRTAQLYLTHEQIYRIAAVAEAERAGLLEEIRRINPDLPLTDLTRDGSSVKLTINSGDHMEILSNELYSLAVYVPDGLESDISRRSGPAFRVGRIVRDVEGVRFHFGNVREPNTSNIGRILSSGFPVTGPPEPVHEPEPVVETAPEAEAASEPAIKEVFVKVSREMLEEQQGEREPVEKPAPEKIPVPTARNKRTDLEKEKESRNTTNLRNEWAPDRKSGGRTLTVSKLTGPAPVLDGRNDDEAWLTAPHTVFPVAAAGVWMETAAVTDGNRIYLLFAWSDQDPETRHQPWKWVPGEEIYNRLAIFDDGIAVQWAMDDEGSPGPLPGRRVFDLWVWRAGREGVGSYASDARLVTSYRPLHLASGIHGNGDDIWNRLEFDEGRLPFEIVLPSIFAGPEIASYAPSRPDGSASDVRSVGGWNGGKWVVEMSRALLTQHEDDVPFDMGSKYTFIVNLFQGKELYGSSASRALTLHW